MSDLSATNCGCDCGRENSCQNNSCLWIILLLLCCGGNSFGRSGCGCDGDNSCLWIILLLLFCGGCGGTTFGGCC